MNKFQAGLMMFGLMAGNSFAAEVGATRENDWSIAAGYAAVGYSTTKLIGPNFTVTSQSITSPRNPRVGIYLHAAKLNQLETKKELDADDVPTTILTAGISFHGPFMNSEKWKTHLDLGFGSNLDDDTKPVYGDIEFGYIYSLPFNFNVAFNLRSYLLMESGTGINIMLSQRF